MITANRLRADRPAQESPAESAAPTVASVQELTQRYEIRIAELENENAKLLDRLAGNIEPRGQQQEQQPKQRRRR